MSRSSESRPRRPRKEQRGGGRATPPSGDQKAGGAAGGAAGDGANAGSPAVPAIPEPPAAAAAGGSAQEARGAREGHPSGGKRRRSPWLGRVDEVSAGGLVLDLAGDVPRGALIGRTDRRGRLLWSLPKGHIEPGETAEQAAVREVAEETGINGEIVATLGTIDFWFIADGRRVHKTVHHYLMRAVGGELSDADVEVTEVAWVPLPDIESRLAYPDERGLVDAAGRLLAESA